MIELPKMEWGEFIIVFFAPMADPKGFQRLLLEGFLDTDNTDLPCGHNVAELHGKLQKDLFLSVFSMKSVSKDETMRT